MAKIISKKIKGFSNYLISSNGTVTSVRFDKERVMSPSTSMGYAKVILVGDNGVKYNFQMHRLVAQAFLKKTKGKDIVNHKDGDKLNNELSNLEWVTRKENAGHYEKEIAPKNKSKRKAASEQDLKTRLSIVDFAYKACVDNPQLFQSVYAANFGDTK